MYYYCSPNQYTDGLQIWSKAKTFKEMGRQLQRQFDAFSEKHDNALEYQMVRVNKKPKGARYANTLVGFYRLENGQMIKHTTETLMDWQFSRLEMGLSPIGKSYR